MRNKCEHYQVLNLVSNNAVLQCSAHHDETKKAPTNQSISKCTQSNETF